MTHDDRSPKMFPVKIVYPPAKPAGPPIRVTIYTPAQTVALELEQFRRRKRYAEADLRRAQATIAECDKQIAALEAEEVRLVEQKFDGRKQ